MVRDHSARKQATTAATNLNNCKQDALDLINFRSGVQAEA
jgi:hypothetical protein